MAKNDKPFMVEKSDLKNMTRSQQRRFIDLGMVKGEVPPAEEPKAKSAK